jgi:hypothetical protein
LDALVEGQTLSQNEIDIISGEIQEKLPFETWLELGKKLRKVHYWVQFAIGDWLNYGEKMYGQECWQAVDQFDYEYEYLRNLKSIAAKIPQSRRRGSLRFSHHQEVASLSEEKQDYWLRTAEEERLTVKQLRESIKKEKGLKEKSKQITQKERAEAWLILLKLLREEKATLDFKDDETAFVFLNENDEGNEKIVIETLKKYRREYG